MTIVRKGESSGPDEDDDTESEKSSGDDGGLSKLIGSVGCADVDGASPFRELDAVGSAGDS